MAVPKQAQASGNWRVAFASPDGGSIDAFLAGYPEVVRPLLAMASQIADVFGTAEHPGLEVVRDPGEGDELLLVAIPSADVGPAILPLIYELDDRWFRIRPQSSDAVVVFDVAHR